MVGAPCPITIVRRGGIDMREGYEGLAVSGIMLAIAFALIAIVKWLF
jgi:hypothetical protein